MDRLKIILKKENVLEFDNQTLELILFTYFMVNFAVLLIAA